MLKNLLLLSAFSAFCVIIIIGLNIYHGYTLSSLPSTTQKRVVPITPTFDKDTIEKLKERKNVSANLSEKTKVVSEDSGGLIPANEVGTQTASTSGSSL